MRREALVVVLEQAKAYHRHAWARTSVEVAIEHFAKHGDRFTLGHARRIDDLAKFVKQARSARAGAGPSQRELNRDSTSFERARAEWSRATVSTRGKVGAGGDGKAQNWLG